jgi:hypothetical protein
MKMPDRSIPEPSNALSPDDILKGAQQTPNNQQLHFDTTDPGYTMNPNRQGVHRSSDQDESGFSRFSDWAGKLAANVSNREIVIGASALLVSGAAVAFLINRNARKNKKDTTWKNPALHRAEGAYWNEHPTNEYP